jgi:hypothetical protein
VYLYDALHNMVLLVTVVAALRSLREIVVSTRWLIGGLVISFALFRPPGSPALLGFSEADEIFSNTLVDRKCAQESKKSSL